MRRVTSYSFVSLALCLLLAVLTGCNSFSAGHYPAEPTITSFTANPTAVAAGGTASLTGVFTNGTGVITPGNISVASGKAVSVSPTQTTTYILTVTNSVGGSAEQAATVMVNPLAPTITSFVANPTAVTAGGTTNLTGVFANGTGVITPGDLPVTSGTAVSVTPTDTTTYTLTVTNAAGATVTQTVAVTVNSVAPAAPTITSFTASSATIMAGGSTNLTGLFTGGTGVITPGNLAATSGTAVSVSPTDTTTYTLTVTNSAGATATKTVTVTVNIATPTITSFAANPASVTAGGSANLTGVFTGGTGVITPGNIAATSGTAVSVTPADTTTYTLTVTNSAGVTASQTATVTILVAQTITFANPGTQTVGTPLTLSATASSGLTVSFTSTTTSVCTVSGTTATFLTAGTCTIDANQAGNSTYAAGPMVARSFTVNARLTAAATPIFSVPAGTYPSAQSVQISCTTANSTIYYTTDDTAPNHNSSVYSSAIAVSSTETLEAICTASGYSDSAIASALYTINASGYYTLPAVRTTLWQPGVTYNGGIPTNRTQCGATVNQSGDTSGTTDTTNIQNALDACTAGHYVMLGPGTFYIASQNGIGGLYIQKSNITLRGSGAGVTTLTQINGNWSVIIVGWLWYAWPADPGCGDSTVNCTDLTIGSVTATSNGLLPLTTDTVKETNTATVATSSISGLSSPLVIGELFHISEQFDPNYIWYNPEQDTPAGQCGTASTATASNVNGYCGWGEDSADNSQMGTNEYLVSRPIGQANMLTGITTNGATTTLTFAAPWHHAFRVSHAADLARINSSGQTVTGVGIEDLTAANGGGGDGGGNVVFDAISDSWMKNIESYNAGGGAVHFNGCFRCELRDSYVHTAGNPNPGGGGYGIEIDAYTSDTLVENNISWSFNKVMVMRSAGGGDVIGYNYFEDGYGAGYGGCEYGSDIGSVDPQGGQPYTSNCSGIPEVGMNATHMTGTQYALFEGNQSFNISEDGTWGNADYITIFRNHATTLRRNVNNGAGTDNNNGANCSTFACFGPVVQLADSMWRIGINVPERQWWHSYIGNVIGYPNNYLQNPAIGYAYPATFSAAPSSATWFFEWNGIHNGGASHGQDPNGSWTATLWEIGDSSGNSPDAPSTIPGAGGQTALNSVLRDGNFDYVTNKTHWMGTSNLCNAPGDAACTASNTGNICTDPVLCAGQYETAPAVSALPNSLYIPTSMQPPPFFQGSTWPWIDGTNASNPIPGTLPARTRFDAGIPNIVPTSSGGGQTQTITFANPGAQTVGTPLTLSATASSGLTVSFTSTTTSVCTVSGTTATFIASGTCTIDANQAGNSTYAPAPMVPQSFSVTANSSGLYTLPSEYTTLWQPGVTYNGGIPTNRTQCGAMLCPAGQSASGSSCTGTASGGDDTTTINNAIQACPDNTFLLLGPGTFHVAGSGSGIYITRSNFTLRGSGANSAGSPGTLISETNKQNVITVGDIWFHWSYDSTCTACNNATSGACVNCTTTTLGKCTNPGSGMFSLAADVVKESNSLMVSSASVAASPALQVGELLAITEQFDPTIEWYNENQNNPNGTGPGQCGVWDLLNGGNSAGGFCGAASTEDQNDAILGAQEYSVSRPTGQVNQLTQIHDNGDGTTTLTFAAPFHNAFRLALGGDVVRAQTAGSTPIGVAVTGVGVEDLSVAHGSGDGGIAFYYTANSWAKNVESYDTWGAAVIFEGAFRSELRDSYIHTAGNPYPGGAGYGIAIDDYTSDTLVENNISWSFNKVMVMGSGGGGNVVAYNYFEDGYGGNYGNCPCPSGWSGCSTSQNPLGQNGPVPWASACSGILETGANAAHGTNTHYTLFEGNQSFNIDEDSTWGNSNYNIFFRNHATTTRRNIGNGSGTETGGVYPDCTSFSCFGPIVQLGDWQNRRGIGITSHHWWHAYVGNVIGYPNGYLANPAIGYAYPSFSPQPVYTTWIYELTGANNSGFDGSNDVPIWQLAYVSATEADQPSELPGADTRTVLNTIIRDGNYDYFSKLVHWHGVPANLGVGATNYGPLCTNGNSNCANEYVAPPVASTLPKSMYIPASMQPPPFFNGGTWPWIDGSNASDPIPGTLPARMRFDAGTPNVVQ